MPKAKSAQSSKKKTKKAKEEKASAAKNYYAVEVIGLLGVGALIYAIFAMLLI